MTDNIILRKVLSHRSSSFCRDLFGEKPPCFRAVGSEKLASE